MQTLFDLGQEAVRCIQIFVVIIKVLKSNGFKTMAFTEYAFD